MASGLKDPAINFKGHWRRALLPGFAPPKSYRVWQPRPSTRRDPQDTTTATTEDRVQGLFSPGSY